MKPAHKQARVADSLLPTIVVIVILAAIAALSWEWYSSRQPESKQGTHHHTRRAK